MKKDDEKFMKKALDLARLGGRDVAPNPMVGAVIVKNGQIIGEGYHEVFGGPHAEVNAIASVKRTSDVDGATMYVTLEPCRTFGKTPPCLDFVEAMGIVRIVCGSRDPLGSGGPPDTSVSSPCKGDSEIELVSCAELRIEFLEGEVADECRALNKFFFTWVEKKRPHITIKIAKTSDGRVAGPNGERIKITSDKQDREVHKMRAGHQAILVGSNTVLSDDPELTVRYVEGNSPLIVIIDSFGRVSEKYKVCRDDNYLIWRSRDLGGLMKYLADNDISSVMVEPGPTLYRVLKEEGLVDEEVVFLGS